MSISATPKAALSTLGRILQPLALAFILGGLVTLGALVAPVMFTTFPIPDAGAAMTTMFRRFDALLLTCVGLLVSGEVCLIIGQGVHRSKRLTLKYITMAMLIGSILYSTLVLNPQMVAMQHHGVRRHVGEKGQLFDTIHRQAETLAKVDLGLGSLLLILIVL